jgi:hypothetical protein
MRRVNKQSGSSNPTNQKDHSWVTRLGYEANINF